MQDHPTLLDTLDVGRVGHDHPETSHNAARTNTLGKRTEATRICYALDWDDQLNAWELHNLYGLSTPNQVATRLGELRDAGLVERLDRTRPAQGNNEGHLHQLTDKGHAALREHFVKYGRPTMNRLRDDVCPHCNGTGRQA